jgi:hypothetical protein
MGKGAHGNFPSTMGASSTHTLAENIPNVTSRYKLSPSGYFGTARSKNTKVRQIESRNPLQTAKDFFRRLSINGVSTRSPRPGITIVSLKDGTNVSFREHSSSDGSPVVEIRNPPSGRVKDQKIHFIEKE